MYFIIPLYRYIQTTISNYYSYTITMFKYIIYLKKWSMSLKQRFFRVCSLILILPTAAIRTKWFLYNLRNLQSDWFNNVSYIYRLYYIILSTLYNKYIMNTSKNAQKSLYMIENCLNSGFVCNIIYWVIEILCYKNNEICKKFSMKLLIFLVTKNFILVFINFTHMMGTKIRDICYIYYY